MAAPGGAMDGRYAHGPGVVQREVDDVVFLVKSGDESVFHLNALGAAVWRLLAEPTSIDEVMEILSSAFPDVEVELIEADVTKLIRRLDRRGLVARSD